MEMTPEAIHEAEFREAKRGGYNTQDVDDFLERVASDIARAQAELRESRQRVEAAEARTSELERRAAEAERRAAEHGDADETLKRTLVLAQRTADAAIKEAEDQAARTLAAAQEQANRMVAEAQEAAVQARTHAEAEARRSAEEARARVLEELRALEASRDQLRSDVDLLDRHLELQRDRVRSTAHELQRLLDDPSALSEMPPPEVSDVQAPLSGTGHDDQPERPLVAPRPLTAPPEEGAPAGADGPPPRPPADVDPGPDPDPGPPTEAVDVLAERDADDEAYLAELRKAMTDDAPLGPREEDDGDEYETEEQRAGRSRFGRRR